MRQLELANLYKSIKDIPDLALFGPYVLEEAPMLAVVLVECSGELVEASEYIYSDIGFGPTMFMLYERVLMPVDGGQIHKYALEDESRLGLRETFSCADLGDDEFWDDLDLHDAESVAGVLVPILSPLTPLSESSISPDDLYEFYEETINKDYPGLLSGEAPNFWK